jgi:hypothetical protein
VTEIINPYWEAVKDRVTQGHWPWEGPCVERFDLGNALAYQPLLDRHEFCARYAWSITDPDSVEFIAAMTLPDGLVDPMAGTGYWAYLLGQLGVDVVCYDANPCHEDNPWHRDAPLWVPVEQGYAEVVIDRHPDRVLFLAWPPYSEPSGARLLREYRGHRVIFIGEGDGGCTGDEDLHELLDAEWHEIASHRPIQWWGLHDDITVYERGPDPEEDECLSTAASALIPA